LEHQSHQQVAEKKFTDKKQLPTILARFQMERLGQQSYPTKRSLRPIHDRLENGEPHQKPARSKKTRESIA
jgi:hypothetical protein